VSRHYRLVNIHYNAVIVTEYHLLFVICHHICINVNRISCTRLQNYTIGASLVKSGQWFYRTDALPTQKYKSTYYSLIK